MSRRTKELLTVAAVMALLSWLGMGMWQWLFGKRISVRQMDRLIRAELPIGADKLEVIRFLDTRHIEHSDYDVPSKDLGSQHITAGAHGVIYGIIRETSGGFLWIYGHIQLVFLFDDRGKLTKYYIKEGVTGW